MTLRDPLGGMTVSLVYHIFNSFKTYNILDSFPFSSETKRMGIIVENVKTKQLIFYMKGADVVMSKIVKPSDWLDEECGNMAREGKYFFLCKVDNFTGLRTLVFGMKYLTTDEYDDFKQRLKAVCLY